MKYRLTRKAIAKITPQIRRQIAVVLHFTEDWIIKLLIQNPYNSDLTKEVALQVIIRYTKLERADLLEQKPAESLIQQDDHIAA